MIRTRPRRPRCGRRRSTEISHGRDRRRRCRSVANADADAARRAASEKTPLLHVAGGAGPAATRYFAVGLGVFLRPAASSGLDFAALGVPRGGAARGVDTWWLYTAHEKKNTKKPGGHAVARSETTQKKIPLAARAAREEGE